MAYLRYRSLMWVLCFGCSFLFVGLLGVAVLLWGTMPEQTQAHAWVLWWVPSVPLLGAVGSLLALLRMPPMRLWDVLQAQVCADIASFKEAKQMHPGWLLIAAALVGAGLATTRPWRRLKCPNLLSGLLGQWIAQALANINHPK